MKKRTILTLAFAAIAISALAIPTACAALSYSVQIHANGDASAISKCQIRTVNLNTVSRVALDSQISATQASTLNYEHTASINEGTVAMSSAISTATNYSFKPSNHIISSTAITENVGASNIANNRTCKFAASGVRAGGREVNFASIADTSGYTLQHSYDINGVNGRAGMGVREVTDTSIKYSAGVASSRDFALRGDVSWSVQPPAAATPTTPTVEQLCVWQLSGIGYPIFTPMVIAK